MSQPWTAVLDFWFLPPSHPEYLQTRIEWFQKNDEFDETIRTRFGSLVEKALGGGLQDWQQTPPGALARILLLDQFTRNIWRDTGRAFAGDALALDAARTLLEQGADVAMAPVERQFVYLPFMHAENLDFQERSVELYSGLAARHPEMASALDFALRHRDIIARFGRFPHRNRQLGRESTPEEEIFLTEPGSGF